MRWTRVDVLGAILWACFAKSRQNLPKLTLIEVWRAWRGTADRGAVFEDGRIRPRHRPLHRRPPQALKSDSKRVSNKKTSAMKFTTQHVLTSNTFENVVVFTATKLLKSFHIKSRATAGAAPPPTTQGPSNPQSKVNFGRF